MNNEHPDYSRMITNVTNMMMAMMVKGYQEIEYEPDSEFSQYSIHVVGTLMCLYCSKVREQLHEQGEIVGLLELYDKVVGFMRHCIEDAISQQANSPDLGKDLH
jgi:hypothetical protein